MRTKTLALSALLGMIGSASLVAQTNVYSVNAVGYINVSISTGFNIITCPLQCFNSTGAADNSVSNILNNYGGTLTGSTVEFYIPGSGYSIDSAVNPAQKHPVEPIQGWANLGTNQMNPGVGLWFQSPSNYTLTFVGQVPQGSLTNMLQSSLNLVGSAVPVSGDIITNSISALTNYNIGDAFEMYDPVDGYSGGIGGIYNVASSKHIPGTGYMNDFSPGDPITYYVSQGFWYVNSTGTPITWVENFSINQ
jgi:hypothetical protein